MKSIKAHPGVFVVGGITFILVEHWLMHRGGMGTIAKARGGG